MKTIQLTDEETAYLAEVLLSVGGDPKGPRGAIDRIYKKLVPLSDETKQILMNSEFTAEGSIYFTEGSIYFNP